MRSRILQTERGLQERVNKVTDKIKKRVNQQVQKRRIGVTMEKIQVRDFGIIPGDNRDSSYRVEKMLENIREKGNTELLFEAGEYHFYPDYAKEILMYIPNHDDDTIKRVVFDLSVLNHVSLKGKNTDFIFHADVLPIYIKGSRQITVEGITIDYARPAYSEGTILIAEPKRMRFAIDKTKYPYEIRNERIFFHGENDTFELYCGCLEFDSKRRGPVYAGHDISFNQSGHDYDARWTEVEEGIVEAELRKDDQKFLSTSKAGNLMVFRHHPRNYPGIYVKECMDICLRDLTVCHCAGMGLIAEFTENITLACFRVTFSRKRNSIFTACADATHFVYCRGLIHLDDCLFENQLDDPVNVHGIYQRIDKILSKKECIIQLVEHQQLGVKMGDPGDRLSVIDNGTMLPVGMVTIAQLKRINKVYCYLRTQEDFPEIKEKFVLENQEYVPDVLIENSIFRNNRARGLLLTSGGKVVVKHNEFQTAGAAVLIEGDSNYWFESGATKDITITKNRFRDCSYVTDWGKAPIQVSPSGAVLDGEERYHKRIEITDNIFECFDERLLRAKNVEMLIFRNNKIIKTANYEPIAGEPFVLEGVKEFCKE